jgi:hypothetical protein
MRRTKKEAGRYFQTVARFFLEQRGVPFFLSSQEVEIIAGWEKDGIPVQTVLQGIKDGFERRKREPGRKHRALSLAFCQPFVDKAFEAYKERRVGTQRKSAQKRDKRKELQRAIFLFLESCPEEIQEIKQVYFRLQRKSSRELDETMLEALEQKVEALLLQKASKEEKNRIRKDVLDEFGSSGRKEVDRIMDLKIAKYVREKYKIPYLSLYYY